METNPNHCIQDETEDFRKGLPQISVHKVSYSFAGKEPVTAIRNISISAQAGQILAIIGESGSGKSTLLKLVYGLLSPGTGEIRFEGYKIPDPKERLIPGHESMRLVTQGFDDLTIYATVWDNVSAQLSNTDVRAKERLTKRILASLRLTHLQDQRVHDLSGGEKQRVAIAIALVNKPKVLLLDEPFNQVDASFREMLQEDILSIVKNTGLTVIMVSHDPTEVLALADQLLIIRKGRKVGSGNPRDLFQRPTNAYVARLLAQANILTPAEAKLIGIESQKKIGIHRQSILPKIDKNGSFVVESIRFKGFHHDLVLRNNDLILRSIQAPSGTFSPGDRVAIKVEDYWEFT